MTTTFQTAESRKHVIAALRDHMRQFEQAGRTRSNALLGSGCACVDHLLPERGFPAGSLVEWLSADVASGAGTFALRAARTAAEQGGAIVVLDRRRSFYPPAAAALGVELKRVVVIRARTVDDELWAFDQALRCSGVAAVWGSLDKLDQRWFRRLQLAAESGGGIGHLLRPARVRGWSSWSYAQLLVEPRPMLNRPAGSAPTPSGVRTGNVVRAGPIRPAGVRRWRVELMRCQGLARGKAVEVELDDLTGVMLEGAILEAAIHEAIHETHPVPLASSLAHPTTRRRSAGA